MTRCSPCSWGRLPVIRVAGGAGGPGPICNELAAVPLVLLAM
ncbi:hypothetical protein [Aeromonas hydrophila]|nr:hypothetical protein [Aeromonas hydrophila]